MKHLHTFSVAALALVLLGAGCNPSLTLSCDFETTWGSCIDENKTDSALLGNWTLQSQTTYAPNGTVTNPFNGRILTFTDEGSYNGYAENWEPEFVETTGYTTDGQLTSTCDAIGTGGGAWAAVPGTDAAGNSVVELRIVPEGNDATVFCSTGAEIDAVSTAASTPLGVGPAKDASTGNYVTSPTANAYVPYTYAISDDGNTLQVIQTYPADLTDQGGDVQTVFIFTR